MNDKTIIPVKYIFDLTVKDNLWKDPIIFTTLFSIMMISIASIGNFFEVKNNWSRMRCRPEVMPFAWIYGEDQHNNMEYCLENAGLQVKQSDIVAPTMTKINNINNTITKKVQDTQNILSTLTKKIETADLSNTNQNKNLAVSIQKNILFLKEGMQKALAQLVLQKNMNNGVLTTTRGTKLLTDSLNKSLAKLPTIKSN